MIYLNKPIYHNELIYHNITWPYKLLDYVLVSKFPCAKVIPVRNLISHKTSIVDMLHIYDPKQTLSILIIWA